MERRSFIFGLVAIATGSGLSALPAEAQAPQSAPLMDAPLDPTAELTLPDGTPFDWSQHRDRHWNHHHRRHHRHRRRHRRQVCRVHRDRFGRRIRRCHWVWV